MPSIGEWGDNLQFYPNFTLFSTLGDETRPLFFSREQIKCGPKKSPKIIQHSDADHSQNIGGCSEIIGGIYPPIPTRGSAPLNTSMICSVVSDLKTSLLNVLAWYGKKIRTFKQRTKVPHLHKKRVPYFFSKN